MEQPQSPAAAWPLLLAAALAGAGSCGALQYQGLAVTSPTSWFNVWFSTPERGPGTAAPLLAAPQLRDRYGYSRYNGPDTWSLDFPRCAGRQQSPIDIQPERLVRLPLAEPLRWNGLWGAPMNLSLTNSGHTVQVAGTWPAGSGPSLEGGPLDGEYEFEHLHFHWGRHPAEGSEHTVLNVSFPLEAHAVFFKSEYGSVEAAREFPDGLAVAAFVFQEQRADEPALAPLTAALGAVPGPDLRAPLPPLQLAALLRPFPAGYVTYSGSLTTPPCSEAVTWLLCARPLRVGRSQLEAFRRLFGMDGRIERNFRPVQATNGRPVYYVS